MSEVSEWLRSGVPPIEPLDTSALLRRAHAIRRRRRRARVAATTAMSLACVAGAVLLVPSFGGEPHDVTASGTDPSTGVDRPCADADADADDDVGPVSWPGVPTSAGPGAVQLADEFSTRVLGIDGTAEVAGSDGRCLVVVDHGSVGQARVALQADGDRFVVSGYAFPAAREDVGLGLSVVGDTVHVSLGRTVCLDCRGRLAVRYGDAQAEGLLDSAGEGQVTIDRDPTVPGTVLMTVLGPEGTVVEAVGVSVPPGDFAAG